MSELNRSKEIRVTALLIARDNYVWRYRIDNFV